MIHLNPKNSAETLCQPVKGYNSCEESRPNRALIQLQKRVDHLFRRKSPIHACVYLLTQENSEYAAVNHHGFVLPVCSATSGTNLATRVDAISPPRTSPAVFCYGCRIAWNGIAVAAHSAGRRRPAGTKSLSHGRCDSPAGIVAGSRPAVLYHGQRAPVSRRKSAAVRVAQNGGL